MALSYSDGLVHQWLNTTANSGKGFGEIFKGCVIDIYAGTRPANASQSTAAVKLGRVTLGGAAFTDGVLTYGLTLGAAANRAINKTASEVWQFTGLQAGTATWFRIRGNAADDGTVVSTGILYPRIDGTLAAFGGDGTLSSTSIVAGNIYTFNSLQLTFPVG